MKVSVNNLGPIKEAEFEIGDLTIICGENNTGKSYLIHATHGFLKTLPSMYFSISQDIIGKLLEGERVTLNLADYRKNLNTKLMELSKEFSEEIGGLLAGSQSQFKDADFHFQLDINKDSPPVTIPMSKFMLRLCSMVKSNGFMNLLMQKGMTNRNSFGQIKSGHIGQSRLNSSLAALANMQFFIHSFKWKLTKILELMDLVLTRP